ncbi:class I SAM-dependent methyltransferase [Kroppenstedtia guangzhouensis]|uniref:class I SAM-dependent methyltransferase n=1 Tax=Kroppenstedtia guangzhouensis TaxID=1274356 RepID=UPI001E318E26|nr:class I SAM-dependent methyltransferase [Kroppenstedtia guangzhouensis]
MILSEDHMYRWPDYYDWTSEGLDGDVTYYADLAMKAKGPVLELGCGTGRCTLGMARHGVEVVGVDKQPEMLAVAEKKAEAMGLSDRCRWVCEDMTALKLERRFSLVIIPYRSFLHLLHVRDQVATLQTIRHHLEDGGCLAFNVFVPDITQLAEEEKKLVHRGVFGIPGTGQTVEVYDYTEFDHFRQQAAVIRYYERFEAGGRLLERLRTRFSMRYVFPTELFHLLRLTGFEVVRRYGGFRKEPFGPESTELVIEAIKTAHH